MRTNLHLKTSFGRFDLLQAQTVLFRDYPPIYVRSAKCKRVPDFTCANRVGSLLALISWTPAPREPLEASLPSGGRRDLEIQRSIGRTTRISGKGVK